MEIGGKAQGAKRKAQSQFGRIGVLMGGPSTEREISLKSGKAVYEALKNINLDVVSIDITTESIKENTRLIKSHKVGCAFLALHGRFGEDGQIQRLLDSMKIPYTGSGAQASRLAMNKIASRRILEVNGLKVPAYIAVEKNSYDSKLKERINFVLPWVVKPATHGSSIGLSIIDRREDLDKAVDLAFQFDERILVEQYIKGKEVTVGILDNEALPVIEIIPKRRFFDYEAKYQPGMADYIVPAELPWGIAENIQRIACSTHRLFGCLGCSRVDMLLDGDDAPFVLELNSIPGFTPNSLLPKAARSAGIEFAQLCVRLLELAYAKT